MDSNKNEDFQETTQVLISPEDLRDLLDRAYHCGKSASAGFPAYLPPFGHWEETRDKWVSSKLVCNSRSPFAGFPCRILGIHKYHSGNGSGGWFQWDDNGMNPNEPDLPAGMTREYYEENKELIDSRKNTK